MSTREKYYLPSDPAPSNPAPRKVPEPHSARLPSIESKTVLLLHDNPGVAPTIIEAIEDGGHFCFHAKTVEQAEKILAEGRTDLVICDCGNGRDNTFGFVSTLEERKIRYCLASSDPIRWQDAWGEAWGKLDYRRVYSSVFNLFEDARSGYQGLLKKIEDA